MRNFWDADSGSVSIGGYDVKNYTLKSLLSNVSMVFQNVYLFSDTIENNIKFGKPEATHEQVIEATANVDPENESELQKAIAELTNNKTIIMITHRLKTVRNADQIIKRRNCSKRNA